MCGSASSKSNADVASRDARFEFGTESFAYDDSDSVEHTPSARYDPRMFWGAFPELTRDGLMSQGGAWAGTGTMAPHAMHRTSGGMLRSGEFKFEFKFKL